VARRSVFTRSPVSITSRGSPTGALSPRLSSACAMGATQVGPPSRPHPRHFGSLFGQAAWRATTGLPAHHRRARHRPPDRADPATIIVRLTTRLTFGRARGAKAALGRRRHSQDRRNPRPRGLRRDNAPEAGRAHGYDHPGRSTRVQHPSGASCSCRAHRGARLLSRGRPPLHLGGQSMRRSLACMKP
jgi:hypothetical protein